VLRGFDVQMAGLIENHMRASGIHFIGPSVPTKIEKLPGIIIDTLFSFHFLTRIDGMLRVYYKKFDNSISSETYETVMFAIGRAPDTTVLSSNQFDSRF
jgi:hypothetical protein